jgi:RNA polymerase sigma-70 factor, ECF subfamily
MDTLSDDELIRAAQQGNLDCFNVLYERYWPLVYRRVRFVIPAEDVEDVTQEVFIAVVRSLKNFRYEARFSTWLRTLVNRQVADFYRSRRTKEAPLGLEDDPELERFRGAELVLSHEGLDDSIVLNQALQKLPDHYREIILLRFTEGLPFEEIARLQSQSLEATKSLFRRAIAALQNLMSNEEKTRS